MTISPNDLSPVGIDLPPDPGKQALTEAWRRSHYAAQAAAEVGKGWGKYQDDDSHSAATWDDPSVSLLWRTPSLAARFRMSELAITVEGLQGSERIDCAGMALDPLIGAVRSAANRLGDAMKQEPKPAPDLPEHPLGSGAEFEAPGEADQALESMYLFTAAALEKFAPLAPDASPVQCWPHHFDIAVLSVVARDGDENMTRTLGVGLTPPDSLSERGYWYVSAWSKDEIGGDFDGDAGAGRWVDRGGPLPMAVLDVDAALGSEDPDLVVTGFLATAANSLYGVLKK